MIGKLVNYVLCIFSKNRNTDPKLPKSTDISCFSICSNTLSTDVFTSHPTGTSVNSVNYGPCSKFCLLHYDVSQ